MDWHALDDSELTAALRERKAKVTMPTGEVVYVFGEDEDGVDDLVTHRELPHAAHFISRILAS